MKTALPAVTKAQSERMGLIVREIGCIACFLDTDTYHEGVIHHLLDTGRRISHDHTICLCEGLIDHHQGNDGIHRAKRKFRGKYGTDDELLALTNWLVKTVRENTT